jgi:seryl-tRNA synthetase
MAFCAVPFGWWSDRRHLDFQLRQARQELIQVQHESMELHKKISQMRRAESDRIAELKHVTDRWYSQVGELNEENEALQNRLQRLEDGDK